jgi:hypothetical protein
MDIIPLPREQTKVCEVVGAMGGTGNRDYIISDLWPFVEEKDFFHYLKFSKKMEIEVPTILVNVTTPCMVCEKLVAVRQEFKSFRSRYPFTLPRRS